MSALRRFPSPRRTWAFCVLVLLIATGFGGAARAQSVGERLIGEWAEALRVGGARVAWSGLARSAGDDRLDLRDVEIDLTVAGSEVAIRLPSAGFIGLTDRPEGGFAVRALTVPRLDATVRAGPVTRTLSVADIEGSDLVVPALALPKIDPDHPFTSAWRALGVLDPLAATRMAVGRVTTTTTANPATPATTWRGEIDGIAFLGVAAGRIEKLRLGAISARGGGDGVFTSAGGEIVGWDLGPWRRLFDDDAYVDGKGDGVWRPILTSAELGATSFEADGRVISVGRMVSAGRELRQFDEPIGRLFDRAMRPGGEPSRAESLRLVIDLFHAARSRGWSAERLHLAGPGLDHFDVARISVGAFSGEGIGEAAIEGLDAVMPNAEFRFAGFRLRDLRLPDPGDLKRAIVAAASGAEIDPSSLIPTLAGLRLDGLEARDEASPMIRLGSFDLAFDRHIRAVPTSGALALSHFVVPVAIGDAETKKTLGRLGYDAIDLSAALRFEWREKTSELAIDEASVELGDGGRLALSGRLTGVPRSLFMRPETIGAVAAGIRLAEATATWTDASAFGRIVAMVAEDRHLKPDRFRRKLLAEIGPSFSDVRDLARRKRMVEAVRRFIREPTMISATAKPEPPIPIFELGELFDTPAVLVERLELTVGAGR